MQKTITKKLKEFAQSDKFDKIVDDLTKNILECIGDLVLNLNTSDEIYKNVWKKSMYIGNHGISRSISDNSSTTGAFLPIDIAQFSDVFMLILTKRIKKNIKELKNKNIDF